jgi:hypothetical protein
MIAEYDCRLQAFSVIWPNEMVRSSHVFSKRDRAGIAPALLEHLLALRVAYCDQLPALPASGPIGVGLAIEHADPIMRRHAATLATAVVHAFRNEAALPLVAAADFKPIGQIDETYEGIGRIRSMVHLLLRHDWVEAIDTGRGRCLLRREHQARRRVWWHSFARSVRTSTRWASLESATTATPTPSKVRKVASGAVPRLRGEVIGDSTGPEHPASACEELVPARRQAGTSMRTAAPVSAVAARGRARPPTRTLRAAMRVPRLEGPREPGCRWS